MYDPVNVRATNRATTTDGNDYECTTRTTYFVKERERERESFYARRKRLSGLSTSYAGCTQPNTWLVFNTWVLG
jgi:hypothetical protein